MAEHVEKLPDMSILRYNSIAKYKPEHPLSTSVLLIITLLICLVLPTVTQIYTIGDQLTYLPKNKQLISHLVTLVNSPLHQPGKVSH
jgi:hypothetical protein